MRWALYARSVSGEADQVDGQLALLEDAVTKTGGTINARFCDLGGVGDGMTGLLKAVQHGQADRVMVWDLPRFGRYPADAQARTLAALHDLRVGVTLAETGEDLDTGADSVLPVAALDVAATRTRWSRRCGGNT
ncbi:recombinase family protein [Streptosporangium sp. CA-115845]|uniref:recombinase family protein n=1 Tax=Streptosporangium sp. CA-115845 TaxID=3240071 RepID=UPI003D941804